MPVPRACPICTHAPQHPIPYRGRAWLPVQPVICQQCALVFINPMYTSAEKEALAPCVRALHRPVRFGRPIQRAHHRELPAARRFLAFARPYLNPGDEVLDIGCGDGALLRTLCQAGAAACGIDLDPEGARFIEQTYGIPVQVGAFEEADFQGRCFDAVVATHVIEHFFEPIEALKKMRTLLKPGGVVVLETPNILRPKVGFRRLFSVPHNYYFSPRTLCVALQRAGLETIAIREFFRDSFLIAARPAPPEAPALPLPADSWQHVLARILSHDLRYKTSLQFVWRKIPGLKRAIMYRVYRDLAGQDLARWLARAA